MLSGIAVRGRALLAPASLALALPAFALQTWENACADRLGDGIAAWLVALTPTLPAPSPSDDWQDAAENEPVSLAAAPAVRGAPLDGKPSSKTARPRGTPKQGIRITSAQVLSLAARRAMPSAVFVKASAQHPAGLLLAGVSGLGVGLQDGDILTEAAGQKASSVAQVVGIVLAARSRQATEISGRFYRAGVPFLLTVEQPYPKAPVPG